MSIRFRASPRWQQQAAKLSEEFLDGELGPQVVSEAQRLVPVDTGELHDSIGHEVDTEGGDAVLYVYAEAPHALHVELGTSRMGAQPYLRPAAFRRYS